MRWHTVQLTRLYRDADGQWRSSHSFGRHDLLVVAKVVDLAHTRICELEAGESGEAAEAGEEVAVAEEEN